MYFCEQHKTYLGQDFSYIDLLQKILFFEKNRKVFAEDAKIKNRYDVCAITFFLYKKQVCKKQRFKHNFVSQEPIYNAIITVKQKFVNLTAS